MGNKVFFFILKWGFPFTEENEVNRKTTRQIKLFPKKFRKVLKCQAEIKEQRETSASSLRLVSGI